MIYLFYIIKEGGLPVWSYRYPQLPKELRERLIGKDESILSGLIRAIWDMGMEIVGEELKVISFGPLNVVLRPIYIGNSQFLAVAFSDSEDNPKLIRRIINAFIKHNADRIANLENYALTDPDEYKRITEDLKAQFTRLLLKHIAKLEIPARRNVQSYLLSIIVGVIVFIFMLTLTYLLNQTYNLIEDPEKLFYVIILLNFFVPSLFVGVFAGSVRNAIASGITLGIIAMFGIYMRWSNVVHQSASYFFKVNDIVLIIIGIILLGILIGGGFGIFAAWMSYFLSEMRWLSPPKETLKKPRFSESVRELFVLIKKSLTRAKSTDEELYKEEEAENLNLLEPPST